jgi:hypothetical protein
VLRDSFNNRNEKQYQQQNAQTHEDDFNAARPGDTEWKDEYR